MTFLMLMGAAWLLILAGFGYVAAVGLWSRACRESSWGKDEAAGKTFLSMLVTFTVASALAIWGTWVLVEQIVVIAR